jgi:LacI family transcriptional regulator
VPSVAAAASPLLQTLPATGRLDGLLIMGVPLEDSMAHRLAKRKLATVLVDSRHDDLNWVNIDDEMGGYQVGAHLIERGHRRLAYVSEGQRSTEYTSPRQLRWRGLTRALHEAGLGDDALQWVLAPRDMQGGRQAAESVLQLDPQPTAVFAHQDDMASGLLSGFRSAGRRVPEDMALVGYDGTILSEALELTSVHQPFAETGRLAASLLLDVMEGTPRPIQHINLTPKLIVRATS